MLRSVSAHQLCVAQPYCLARASSAACRAFSASASPQGFLWRLLGLDDSKLEGPTIENRFHMLDESPYEDLRRRAVTVKAKAKCPVSGLPIQFVCPRSGIPTHHDEACWKADKRYWDEKIWEKLRWANVFEHDLRSGRDFPELEFPGKPGEDMVANLYSWDTYFYSRNYYSMDTEFSLAVSTKLLSYPMTIAGVLDQYSPYKLKPKGPLTYEGLKSAAALRYTMYPQERSREWQDRPMRLFILGARSEAQLPPLAWKQLSFLMPGTRFELVFIGPESCYDIRKGQYRTLERPETMRIDQEMSFIHYTDYFHVLNEARDFMPYDPYLDAFFLFHPGLGAPETMDMWEKSLPGLLETKCPIYVTGFHDADSQRDWEWLHAKYEDELDVLIEPTSNVFKALKYEFNDSNPQEVYRLNERLFAFRGKRYHVQSN